MHSNKTIITILTWCRIIRPQTLFASICPVAVPYVSHVLEFQNSRVALITLLCAICLQILSNLINDYYDFMRGADKQGRVGFRRALAEGEVSPKQVLIACGITAALCLIMGLYLVIHGGWVILVIGVSALLFAWLYTATSYSLSYLGIADIFVFLYYGVIASCGTYYLQTGSFAWDIFYSGAVCGLISMCVLMINNLRDIDDDRAAGKRTLPVRFGKKAGLGLMIAYVVLMPIMTWLAYGFSVAMAIVLPAAILVHLVKEAHGDGELYNLCLLYAGVTNLLYVILVVMEQTLELLF